MHKREKAPEKIELGFAVFLDLDPALRAAQHAHKAAQQQFRQRVEHFRLLPRLRYFLEKLTPAEPMTNHPPHREPPPVGDSRYVLSAPMGIPIVLDSSDYPSHGIRRLIRSVGAKLFFPPPSSTASPPPSAPTILRP